MNDFKLALRQLLKNPGFTVVAVLTLTLGIGANTAMFSVINGVLFRPLPFAEPGRLVWIANPDHRAEGIPGLTGQANLRDWSELNQSFECLAAYLPSFSERTHYTLTDEGEPTRLKCAVVTGNFLKALGLGLGLGRGFTDEECRRNGPRAVILTDPFWKRRFHADAGIVGRSITINNLSWTVVGVLPASFDFSSIFAVGSQPLDFLRPHPDNVPGYDNMGSLMAVIGRLKPGITLAQAQSEFTVLNQQLEVSHPERGRFGARLSPLREHISGPFRRPFLMLSAAVGCLLLIACANLSNLLMARAATRRKELAIRLALGASRWQLVRQTLTESLLLSAVGAALGLPLSYGVTNVLAQSHGFGVPLLSTARVDGLALAFTVGLSLATALVFGAFPALQLSQGVPFAELKDASRGSSQGRRGVRMRQALVVSEIALTCVLLVGAGLLVRSFARLRKVDPGFRPEQVAVWHLEPNRVFDTPNGDLQFYDEVLRHVQALPGITSATLTDKLPMDLNDVLHVGAKGESYRPSETPVAFARFAQSGYFATMRIPLRTGRDFDSHDVGFDWHKPERNVAIINETFARKFWPGLPAVGRTVMLESPPESPVECEVVGVVGDVRQSALDQAAGAEIYLVGGGQYLVARTSGALDGITGAVGGVLKELDPTMAVPEAKPLSRIIDREVAPRRLITQLLGAFSVLALLLASLGIYGVIAYSVGQRTQEIGIRLALGSSRPGVMRLIVGEGVRLAIVGCVIGLLASLPLVRTIKALLFETNSTDPVTLASSAFLLIAVALLACWLPARRAIRVDPVVALRHD